MLDFCLASKNPRKKEALLSALAFIDQPAELETKDISSGVDEQPRSFQETLQGARNRARSAQEFASVGVGLEGGVMQLDSDEEQIWLLCVASVFDGKSFFDGCSPAIPLPEKVAKLIFQEKLDLNEALFQAGETSDAAIGQSQGAIGLLSQGTYPRVEFMKQALLMSLFQWQRASFDTTES